MISNKYVCSSCDEEVEKKKKLVWNRDIVGWLCGDCKDTIEREQLDGKAYRKKSHCVNIDSIA